MFLNERGKVMLQAQGLPGDGTLSIEAISHCINSTLPAFFVSQGDYGSSWDLRSVLSLASLLRATDNDAAADHIDSEMEKAKLAMRTRFKDVLIVKHQVS